MNRESLLVDDNTGLDNNRWAAHAREAGCAVSCIVRAEDSISVYRECQPSVAIMAPLESTTAMLEALHKLRIIHPDLPVVVITEEPELFSTAMCGPFDGVTCIEPGDVGNGLREALQTLFKASNLGRGGSRHPVIIGRSRTIQEIRRKILAVADKPVVVLVTGESGTGKELIVRALHCRSDRSGKALVKVNCGALPDTLLESEVFGYHRGAFTGAHADKPGRLEMAHQGTLFIDEIGALPLALQVKFLQVLEDKVFSRLGGIWDQTIETRVIAATNVDLLKQVREGRFRRDLYFRLAVIHIQSPPLRDRSEDIPLLVHYFLHKYSVELGRQVPEVTPAVMDCLGRYAWPGNIRELENFMRRAVVIQGWGFLEDSMAVSSDLGPGETSNNPDPDVAFPLWSEKAIQSFLAQKGASLKTLVKAYTEVSEREAIEEALKQVRWNRKQAAELLGVSYKTLLNRINALDLNEESF